MSATTGGGEGPQSDYVYNTTQQTGQLNERMGYTCNKNRQMKSIYKK